MGCSGKRNQGLSQGLFGLVAGIPATSALRPAGSSQASCRTPAQAGDTINQLMVFFKETRPKKKRHTHLGQVG